MKTYKFTIGMLPNVILPLGVQGENGAREIRIDYTEWVKEGFTGYPQIAVLQPTGDAYAAVTTIETEPDALLGERNIISWILTTTDTAEYGVGMVRVTITDNNIVLKSAACRYMVEPSLARDIPDAPDAFGLWMQQLMDRAAQTSANAILAERYSNIAGAYAESCVGGDPEIVDELLRKAIVMEIGTVTTLEPGNDATVTVDEGNVISFGIPKGEKGDAFTYDDFTPDQLAGLVGPQGPQGPAGPAVATIASANALGCIKVGDGLEINAETGVLKAIGTESPEMTGATAIANGTGGTVPYPPMGANTKFLRGDATWANPPLPDNATTSSAGLMSAADKTKLDGIETGAKQSGYQFLWNPKSTVPIETAQKLSNEYPWPFDFLLIEYSFNKNPYSDPSGCYYLSLLVPLHRNSINPNANATFDVLLQANDVSSNKNASRRCTITLDSESGVYITFHDAYYNGAKNNNYIYPGIIYGVVV